jgi:energy-coupling factor transporter transmembrane protein EcfT
MAYLTLFHVTGRRTALHSLDPRVKTAAVLAVSIAVFMTGMTGKLVLTVGAAALVAASGIPVGKLLRDMRFLLVLAVVIFAAGALGRGFGGISPVTLEEGGTAAWKFLLFITYAAVFTGTTTPGEMRDGLTLILKSLPCVPAVRIATMISMTLTFVPLLFDRIRTVSEAQASRCVYLRRNPVYRFRALVLPVIISIAGSVDAIADAMESRSFTEERTIRSLTFCARDWVVLGGTVVLCLGIVMSRRYLP